MAGFFPAHRRAQPPRAWLAATGRLGGLSHHDGGAIVWDDRCLGDRLDGAHSADATVRPLQIMADLFAPLVGERAEQFAGSLLTRFGGLSAAMRAAPDANDLNDTEREALLLVGAAQRIASAALVEGVASSVVHLEDDGFKQYLRSSLATSGEERLLAVFLDGRGHFLRDELLARGNLKGVPLPLRRLSRRTLELEAAGVILAHNHPSGCDRPSQEDCLATTRVHAALASIEVDLLDHLIVTREHVFSIRRGERV